MQKKLIALAVAGLVSAPAFAQSNVTIYGLVDVGVSHYAGSSTYKNRTGLDSGLQSGSRLGFRGVEDLGNGLKASFVLEWGHNPDVNNTLNSNRQSFVALSGGFGTVALGRQYTPQHTFFDSIDPFNTGTVGNVEGVYSAGVIGSSVIRLDNVIAYVSPNLSGLTVTAAYTANGLGDEEVTLKGTSSGNAKIWAINPVYKNGPLLVGFNYHQVKIDATDFDNKVWDLGGAYDFGAVRLSGLYGQSKTDNDKQKQWMLGATVPVGQAGKVLVSYISSEFDSGAEGDKWSLGYTHDLSKRTNLYAAFAKTSDDAYFGKGNALDYNKGFNLGIRHKF